MDLESFKAAVKAAGFHKAVETAKLNGNTLTVTWKSKAGKEKKHAVALSAAVTALDRNSAEFVKAAAKEFSERWDKEKKNDD